MMRSGIHPARIIGKEHNACGIAVIELHLNREDDGFVQSGTLQTFAIDRQAHHAQKSTTTLQWALLAARVRAFLIRILSIDDRISI